MNTELILIRITGEDRPGLTASVTEILAKYDATILDLEMCIRDRPSAYPKVPYTIW